MISKNQLPESGFFAVIFSSEKSSDLSGYPEMDDLTMKLAAEQKGYLGYESLSNGNKTIFISYWKDMDSIYSWRDHATHRMAKAQAGQWYSRYLSQICLVNQHRIFEQ